MVIIIEKCEGGLGLLGGGSTSGPPSGYRGGPSCYSTPGWWLSQGEWSDPGRAGGYTPTPVAKNLYREFFGRVFVELKV